MTPKVNWDLMRQGDWDLLSQICERYYIQQQTQFEIAETLHLSRVMVSRLLTEAIKIGVVEFKINRTSTRQQDLEDQLRTFFPEVEFVVVRDSFGNMNEMIGRQAAVTAERFIFDGSTLAISYGTAVYQTIKAIPAHHFRKMTVVQMAGVEGATNPEIDGWQLVKICAERLGGAYRYLSASLFSSTSEIHTALQADKKIEEIFNIAKESDLAIVGIGSMDPENSSVVRAGHLTLERLQYAAKAGSVGYIGGQHFNIQGDPLSGLNNLTMSLDLKFIRDIPAVIGVAHGTSKIQPLVGALRGQYLTCLVIDDIAAIGIIKFLSQNRNLPEEATSSRRLRNKERTKKRRQAVHKGESVSISILGKGKNVR